MGLLEVNRDNQTIKKGRVAKKVQSLEPFVFVQELKRASNEVGGRGSINLLNREQVVQDGIIYCNQRKHQLVYKFGAKIVSQKPMVSKGRSGLSAKTRVPKYQFWVPDLYFFLSVNFRSIYIGIDANKKKLFPISNLFDGTRPRNLYGGDVDPEIEKFAQDKNLDIHECCVGGSLNSFSNIRDFKDVADNSSKLISTLMSAKGNTDLALKCDWAREIASSVADEESHLVGYHVIYTIYSKLTKDIKTEEEFNRILLEIPKTAKDMYRAISNRSLNISEY